MNLFWKNVKTNSSGIITFLLQLESCNGKARFPLQIFIDNGSSQRNEENCSAALVVG